MVNIAHFNIAILDCYKWLGYFVNLDACFCLPCSLFGKAGDAKKFVWKPVTNWTTFNNKVKGKSTCPTLIKCASAMVSFMEVQSGNQLTINAAVVVRSYTITTKKNQLYYRLYCFMWQAEYFIERAL